jgi:catechol-2,3-dioxygenase
MERGFQELLGVSFEILRLIWMPETTGVIPYTNDLGGTMKIGHIELFVANPSASKEFFEKVLGFELVTQQSENLIWLK